MKKIYFKKILDLLKNKLIAISFALLIFLFLLFLILFSVLANREEGNSDKYTSDSGSRENVGVEERYRGPLFFASYHNPFYNLSGIMELYGLYFDASMLAIMFPPIIEFNTCGSYDNLEKIHFNSFPDRLSIENENFQNDYEDLKCIDDICLSQKDLSLSLSGKSLTLPRTENEKIALTIESVVNRDNLDDSFFLLGITTKEANGYKGYVYKLSLRGDYSRLLSETDIGSEYFGLIGFGGTFDDYLVIYGAEKGIAYRIRIVDEKELVEDLSDFFNYRVMGGGFKAAAIRVVADDFSSFYVYSFSDSRPRLIKLWENELGEGVSGAIALTDKLPLNDNFIIRNHANLKANILSVNSEILFTGDSQTTCYSLSDYGFDNSNLSYLTTSAFPNNGNIDYETRIRDISKYNIALDSYSSNNNDVIKTYFRRINSDDVYVSDHLISDDIKDILWSEIANNNYSPILEENFRKFMLKVEFLSQESKYISPFLSSISLNYHYSKH